MTTCVCMSLSVCDYVLLNVDIQYNILFMGNRIKYLMMMVHDAMLYLFQDVEDRKKGKSLVQNILVYLKTCKH